MSPSAVLFDALTEPARIELRELRPRLEAWIERAWEEARVAWPAVRVSPEEFGRRAAAAMSALPRPAEYERLHVTDLYLACGCASGDGGAIDAFVRAHLPAVARALTRMGIEESQRSEVLSRIREQLFVQQASGAPPLTAAYAGRGSLRSWVQSIGIHAALKTRRGRDRIVPIEQLASNLRAGGPDPEIDYLARFYLAAFRSGLANAMKTLPRRERNLLRQHYLDGMSLEAIARAYRVHRATAARWLSAARDTVLTRTKEELAAALRLDSSELESVLGFVRGRSTLEASFSSVLGVASRRPG